jgi:ATPase family protein associated with various cellular activities (AAA)
MPRERRDDHARIKLLDFPKLEGLRLLLRQVQQYQIASLDYFSFKNGFKHTRDGEDKISVSSTATCVLSLVATGSWKASPTQTKELLDELVSKKTSAGLKDNNPFTIAWILEAVTALEGSSDPLGLAATQRITEIEEILQNAVKTGNGGVSIDDYPASAYLTQLVVRALRNRSKLTESLDRQVKTWAWTELPYQLALIQAESKTADAFAVAYLLMLVAAVTPRSETSPEQTYIQRSGLKIFFQQQLDDGTWPLSRPLFHYKRFGNAYCYEYEMLTQLLQQSELDDLLLEFLPQLRDAANSVLQNVYRVEAGVRAWTSGHHPQLKCPESWATASVFHFAQVFDRLLAEAIRRELFRYSELPFPRTSPPGTTKADFAKDFLDSTITLESRKRSLKEFLWEEFVEPLAAEAAGIAKGRPFKKWTPRSAIFFGPPGTSKTELSMKVADFLGWPHLAVDPSLLLRNGMEGIQAEANAIFRILEETERVVVLFDEFDELVRERGSSDGQPFSRLLTTAMLPKLASIHKRARLVFIIATNNISDFDLAIRRPGRFDRVVQIMPPTYQAKIAKKDWGSGSNVDFKAKFRALEIDLTESVKKKLADLTYSECDSLATNLANADTKTVANSMLASHWQQCTLQMTISKAHVKKEEKTTWAQRSNAEAQFNR